MNRSSYRTTPTRLSDVQYKNLDIGAFTIKQQNFRRTSRHIAVFWRDIDWSSAKNQRPKRRRVLHSLGASSCLGTARWLTPAAQILHAMATRAGQKRERSRCGPPPVTLRDECMNHSVNVVQPTRIASMSLEPSGHYEIDYADCSVSTRIRCPGVPERIFSLLLTGDSVLAYSSTHPIVIHAHKDIDITYDVERKDTTSND